MKEFSILIGGKAGDGIDKASIVIGQILSHLGYRIFIHRDYPSLIRGDILFQSSEPLKERLQHIKNR